MEKTSFESLKLTDDEKKKIKNLSVKLKPEVFNDKLIKL